MPFWGLDRQPTFLAAIAIGPPRRIASKQAWCLRRSVRSTRVGMSRAIIDHHVGMALQNAHANQDRRASARVLPDHVEHRIAKPVIVDAGRDQDRLTRS